MKTIDERAALSKVQHLPQHTGNMCTGDHECRWCQKARDWVGGTYMGGTYYVRDGKLEVRTETSRKGYFERLWCALRGKECTTND